MTAVLDLTEQDNSEFGYARFSIEDSAWTVLEERPKESLTGYAAVDTYDPEEDAKEGLEEYANKIPEDLVHSPKHYQVFPDIEAIDVIAKVLTPEQFKGYCLGNMLKYRLRAGKKDNLQQDINKAEKYSEIYENYSMPSALK